MSGILSAFGGGSYGSPPANTVAPAVTGTATFGQTLSTTNGTWTGVPTPTFTYQWQRASVNISGATSSTYTLVAADVGNTIRCVVAATNAISAVSANSNSTASVAATVPGAPTIGTATQTGSTTATITYTAPASNGGATITSYTAVSSPGSITGTLSQAGSGTITVSGLTASTNYTFTIYATNSVGNSASSSASNSITTAAPPYMCITTSGATVITCGNYKIARWTATGYFMVNSLGSSSGYGDHINVYSIGGGSSGVWYGTGGNSGQIPSSVRLDHKQGCYYPAGNRLTSLGCLSTGGVRVYKCNLSSIVGRYTVTVGGGGSQPGGSSSYSSAYGGSCSTIGPYDPSNALITITNASGGQFPYNAVSNQQNYPSTSVGSFSAGKCGCWIVAGRGGDPADLGIVGATNAPLIQRWTSCSFNWKGGGNGGFPQAGYAGVSGVPSPFTSFASPSCIGGGGGGGYSKRNGYNDGHHCSASFGLAVNGGGNGGAFDQQGATTYTNRAPANGAPNTGGGGGGGTYGSSYPGTGGSGQAMIRWRFQ